MILRRTIAVVLTIIFALGLVACTCWVYFNFSGPITYGFPQIARFNLPPGENGPSDASFYHPESVVIIGIISFIVGAIVFKIWCSPRKSA